MNKNQKVLVSHEINAMVHGAWNAPYLLAAFIVSPIREGVYGSECLGWFGVTGHGIQGGGMMGRAQRNPSTKGADWKDRFRLPPPPLLRSGWFGGAIVWWRY